MLINKTSVSANIAVEGADIGKVVLMPGDPLRAKHVAETFLSDVCCFNTVRNMLGFTGSYKDKRVSVMGSGMGVPSLGLYATELFTQFDVEAIIRIGSAGALPESVRIRDLVIAMTASSDSNYASAYGIPGYLAPCADYELLSYAVDAAKEIGASYRVGQVYTCDHFYYPDDVLETKAREIGILAEEMETAGLYWTAMACGRRALSLLTISDHLLTHEWLSVEERQDSFHEMMEVALETAWRYS